MSRIRRALISVSDVTGLEELALALHELGIEIVASSGTGKRITEAGVPWLAVEEVTGAPEMLGGRVKTLHPGIHGGILARRDVPEDLARIEEFGIKEIGLVVVNLYPFRETVATPGITDAEVIEKIDVGGPAMVRAAAKNHQSVGVVTSPSRYAEVIAELREHDGVLSDETRRRLAAEAFTMTAGYDAAISAWFMGNVALPDEIVIDLQRERELPYGENPHQAAAYYVDRTASRHLLTGVVQHGGKGLSYNNLADLAAAHAIANEFEEPACAIIKHQNPCGVALGGDAAEAYEKALAGDPVSAFGGVIAINRPITSELGARLAEQFLEVVIAPGFEDGALEALAVRPNTRLLEDTEPPRRGPLRHYRPVPGGMLVQDPDSAEEPRAAMTVVTSVEPDSREWADLVFAWRIVRHVSSNAIVIARDAATLGIGAGQMSRVDSVRIAVEKTPEDRRAGAVLASDAFFPFPDGAELALQAGITAIIQPGGAKRDDEVTAAVDAAGAAMLHVGRRHFRH